MGAQGEDFTRSRVITWQSPDAVRAEAVGWSGLQIMQGIRDGTLPPPPMARLIGFRCVVAEAGEIVMALEGEESLENTIGILHGGTAAAMLDTAMGAAAHTMMAADKMVVTLDIKLTYLRPLMVKSGTIRARGKVMNLSARNVYVEGWVHDGRDRLAVHAVGNFSVIGG